MNEEELRNHIGLNCDEIAYRNMPYPSYSLLSDIHKSGGSVVNGVRNTDINELDGVMVGKLVDNLLTENKLPDNFYVVKKKPTGKAKDLLKVLAETHKYHPNKKELLHKDNHVLLTKCCDTIGYYKKTKNKTDEDALQKRLLGLENYEEYYNILLSAPKDSFIISDYLYYQAKQVIKVLRNEFPEFFPSDSTSYRAKVIPQVKLLGEYNGTKIKGMLDFVVVLDKEKVIIPIDLKTGSYNAEDFFEKGYLGWNYYIQAALYKELITDELKTHPIYKDYKVDNFRFIFAGRMDNSTTGMIVLPTMHKDALEGFKTSDGREFKGVKELIEIYNKFKK